MLSKRYESTEVDRRTWLHVPSGTHWSTSSDTHQVVEIQIETSTKMYTPLCLTTLFRYRLTAGPGLYVSQFCFYVIMISHTWLVLVFISQMLFDMVMPSYHQLVLVYMSQCLFWYGYDIALMVGLGFYVAKCCLIW